MMLPSKNDLFSAYQTVSNKVKQYAKNLSPLEIKVEEATSNEPWGPHGSVMAEITKASYDFENYKQIMGVVARRLQSEGEVWRHVYKSLLLLEYLCKHGPQKVVDELSSNVSVIEKLQRFQYKDKNSKDWGLNVRQRAKELTSLVTNPERIKRERQMAKQNESKYTGVSSDDARMGGFGSSSGGFGSDTASSRGGSALGGSALGGLGGSSSRMGGFSSSDYRRSGRYDSDNDPGHHYNSGDLDTDIEVQDTKEATRKRIESLQADTPGAARARSSPLKGGRAASAGPEAEARGPKRLSQVKVDPSIAKSIGGLKIPASSVQPKAAQSQSTPAILDLFGDSEPQQQAAGPPAASASSWGAFGESSSAAAAPQAPHKEQSDDWANLLGDKPVSSAADTFGGMSGHPAPAAASSPAFDPFAVSSGANTSADPFSQATAVQRKASGPLPLAPTPPKADSDPFAMLTSADPFATPAPKPQSPLRAVNPSQAPKPASSSGGDPFAASLAGPSTSSAVKAGSPTSRLGQALPEDMFAASPTSSGPAAGVRVHVQGGQGLAQHGGFSASPGRGQTQNGMDAFGAFGSASPATEMTVGGSAAKAEALGGGLKMAPNVPQPNLPPPVNKTDPFAGLAGF